MSSLLSQTALVAYYHGHGDRQERSFWHCTTTRFIAHSETRCKLVSKCVFCSTVLSLNCHRANRVNSAQKSVSAMGHAQSVCRVGTEVTYYKVNALFVSLSNF